MQLTNRKLMQVRSVRVCLTSVRFLEEIACIFQIWLFGGSVFRDLLFFEKRIRSVFSRGYFFLGGRITLVKACLSGTWVCFVFN